jgi:uncharacterized protein YecT (DUF1311 family)
MNNKIQIIIFFSLIIFMLSVSAQGYSYKKVEDFKTLEHYKTVTAFEQSYKSYIQDCLDNTGGGTGGIQCLIADKIWDRELNIYYKKLFAKLDDKGNDLLKKSQQEWMLSRDLSLKFSEHFLDLKFKDEEGTLNLLLRADEDHSALTQIIKERALWLKGWLDSLSKSPW